MSTIRLPCSSIHARVSRLGLLGCAAVAILIMLPTSVQADVNWNVSSGDWSIVSNWNTGVLPTSADSATIANGGTASITTTGPQCESLSLGGSDGSGTVQMTAGSLSASLQTVGDSGMGSFTQSGGTNNAGNLFLTAFALSRGESGTYNLYGSGLLSVPGDELVGASGTGIFTQSGGTNAVGSLAVGYGNPDDNFYGLGAYNLSGTGLLSAADEGVGDGGTGNFTQTGGTNLAARLVVGASYYFRYGVDPIPIACTYNLSGPALVSVSGVESIETAGTFTQTGGTNAAASLNLSNGGYNLGGSGLVSVSGTEDLEYTSALTQTGGTNTATSFFLSSGAYNLSGSGLVSVPRVEWIETAGTFTQTGGTNAVGCLYMSDYSGPGYVGSGYNLSGSGVLSCAGTEYVGENLLYFPWNQPGPGAGTFTQCGGTNIAGAICLANYSPSSGAYNSTAASWT